MTKKTLNDIIVLVANEIAETIKIDNPCQMWARLDALFDKYGNEARIQVTKIDGTLYKDWTRKQLKTGSWIKVNSIKETNRGYLMALKKQTIEKQNSIEKANNDVIDAINEMENLFE